jgi:hypothetical protein
VSFMPPLCEGDYARAMWIDGLMVILVVGFFALAAALIAWLDRI